MNLERIGLWILALIIFVIAFVYAPETLNLAQRTFWSLRQLIPVFVSYWFVGFVMKKFVRPRK